MNHRSHRTASAPPGLSVAARSGSRRCFRRTVAVPALGVLVAGAGTGCTAAWTSPDYSSRASAEASTDTSPSSPPDRTSDAPDTSDTPVTARATDPPATASSSRGATVDSMLRANGYSADQAASSVILRVTEVQDFAQIRVRPEWAERQYAIGGSNAFVEITGTIDVSSGTAVIWMAVASGAGYGAVINGEEFGSTASSAYQGVMQATVAT